MRSWLRALGAAAFLMGALPSQAADSDVPSAAPVTDPAQVAAHFRQVVARPAFQEPSEPDAGNELKAWFSQWFTRLGREFGQLQAEQEMPRFASLLMSLLVLLCLVGLIYGLVRLTRRRVRWEKPAPPEDGTPAALRPPEFYEEELRQAAARGDWHAAWLATWRQFLSQLEKERLVEADRSRTNREYLAQLETQPQTGSAFALLARMVNAYDNFIYGQQPIRESDWRSFHQQVSEAALLLHLPERRPPDAAAPKPA